MICDFKKSNPEYSRGNSMPNDVFESIDSSVPGIKLYTIHNISLRN